MKRPWLQQNTRTLGRSHAYGGYRIDAGYICKATTWCRFIASVCSFGHIFYSSFTSLHALIYDGIQAISDGKIGWSKFLVKNHPGPLREHILIGLDPKNCLKFSKKVNFMIFKNLVKSTKAKMAISEILPFSGKIVIAAKRKGLKRSPICQNWGILIVSKGVWSLAPKKYILGGEMVT